MTIQNLQLWHKVINDLDLLSTTEDKVHPHIKEEQAELFHISKDANTEFEVLNFLHSLVILFKPKNVLETGTFTGISSLAISLGLKFNGFGKLTTIDHHEVPNAQALWKKYSVDDIITLETVDSLSFCKNYSNEPLDFVFFDTDINIRHLEFNTLYKNNKISKNAIICFHDTSKIRIGQSLAYITYLNDLNKTNKGLESFLSRGLRVYQL